MTSHGHMFVHPSPGFPSLLSLMVPSPEEWFRKQIPVENVFVANNIKADDQLNYNKETIISRMVV